MERRKHETWHRIRQKKKVGLNEASKIYGVPKDTLKRRLDGKNQKATE